MKEIFNDTLNTFYLSLYGVKRMDNDHSDSERGHPLHELYFLISCKGSYLYTLTWCNMYYGYRYSSCQALARREIKSINKNV